MIGRRNGRRRIVRGMVRGGAGDCERRQHAQWASAASQPPRVDVLSCSMVTITRKAQRRRLERASRWEEEVGASARWGAVAGVDEDGGRQGGPSDVARVQEHLARGRARRARSGTARSVLRPELECAARARGAVGLARRLLLLPPLLLVPQPHQTQGELRVPLIAPASTFEPPGGAHAHPLGGVEWGRASAGDQPIRAHAFPGAPPPSALAAHGA